MINRQVLLAARPVGEIQDSDFGWGESPVPPIEDKQVLVRNLYLSLDPAMRGWMRDADSYIEPIPVGGVMRGLTLGRVVASRHTDFAEGDLVRGTGGWQDYVVYGPKGLPTPVPTGLPAPPEAWLSVLGVTGLTAYFGILDIGQPKAGETVVVSTAAGAVGSIVCQIAKLKGCRVVGIAGSDEKCRWVVEELGADACINYKTERIETALKRCCPDKIDVYFDNVGGDILNAVLARINIHARIVICGAITQYNATEPPPGPSNYITLLTKRSRMEGFIVLDYAPRFAEATQQLAQWFLEGKLKYKVDVVDGLENAPKAIHRLFDGTNNGKLIIRIAQE